MVLCDCTWLGSGNRVAPSTLLNSQEADLLRVDAMATAVQLNIRRALKVARCLDDCYRGYSLCYEATGI